MKTRSIRIDITEEQFVLLKNAKDQTGVPRVEQIRRAIAAHFQQQKKKERR